MDSNILKVKVSPEESKGTDGKKSDVRGSEVGAPKSEHLHQNAPKPKNKKRKIEGIKAGREAYRQRLQSGKAGKSDKPKSAPEQKRETKKERKARLSREGAEQRKAAKGSKKPVSPNPEKSKQELSSNQKAKSKNKKEIKQLKVEDLKVKFTRKLKDVADSIRNKVYRPHKTAFKITGVAALASLLILAGVRGYSYFNDAEVRGAIANTTTVVNLLEGEKEIKDDGSIISSKTVVSATTEETAPKGTPTSTTLKTDVGDGAQSGQTETGTQNETYTEADNKTSEKTQDEGKDASKEYLSSIRIGTIMQIDKGKYFPTPEGTGNPGNFENYKDYDKVLTEIGIAPKEGYIQIGKNGVFLSTYFKDYFSDAEIEELKNKNLYELKQLFPDAKFSYHFGGEHKEDRGKQADEKRKIILGWLTENSLEQTIDNTRNQKQMEDFER